MELYNIMHRLMNQSPLHPAISRSQRNRWREGKLGVGAQVRIMNKISEDCSIEIEVLYGAGKLEDGTPIIVSKQRTQPELQYKITDYSGRIIKNGDSEWWPDSQIILD